MAMSFQNVAIGGLIAVTFLSVGCESANNTSGASMNELASAANAQRTAAQSGDAASAAADSVSQQASAAESAATDGSRKVAGREGVGEGGYFTAIVGARRHVLNRVEDFAWLQGVQHFQAEHGRLPKDHAEFMSKVVEFHGIDLGYKEEDQEFLYDPSAGQWGEVYVVEKLEQTAQQ